MLPQCLQSEHDLFVRPRWRFMNHSSLRRRGGGTTIKHSRVKVVSVQDNDELSCIHVSTIRFSPTPDKTLEIQTP
jgi:hypothetical protein